MRTSTADGKTLSRVTVIISSFKTPRRPVILPYSFADSSQRIMWYSNHVIEEVSDCCLSGNRGNRSNPLLVPNGTRTRDVSQPCRGWSYNGKHWGQAAQAEALGKSSGKKPWSQSRLEFAVWPQTRKSQLLNSLVSKVRSSACLSPSCYQLLHAKIQQNNIRPGLYGREQSPTKYSYIRKLTRGRNDLCSLGTCSAWIRWGRSSYWENPLTIS